MRNERAKGSPSGLNQTSAILSPPYFKAAHCFDGGCSKKFTPHLPLLDTNHSWQLLASDCNSDSGKGKDGWQLEVRLPLWCVGPIDRRIDRHVELNCPIILAHARIATSLILATYSCKNEVLRPFR